MTTHPIDIIELNKGVGSLQCTQCYTAIIASRKLTINRVSRRKRNGRNKIYLNSTFCAILRCAAERGEKKRAAGKFEKKIETAKLRARPCKLFALVSRAAK